jgi:excisionase family DNA binding protein
MPKATAPQSLDRDWFTVGQAAAYLGKTTRTIHRWMEGGLLPFSQPVPNGSILISAISIEKLLEKTRH